MLQHSSDPTCYLVNFLEFDDCSSNLPIEDVDALKTTATWVESFLTKPHTLLGRSGPVCPYTRPSIDLRLFWMTVHRGGSGKGTDDFMMKLRDWFMELEPTEGKNARYKTIVALFPDIPMEAVEGAIDGTQAKMKGAFVAEGLMIGQFHEKNDEPGLWNPGFRPLRSPIPLLAIRHMVESDFPFLQHDRDYVEAYLRIYGANIPDRVNTLVNRALAQFEISETAVQFGS